MLFRSRASLVQIYLVISRGHFDNFIVKNRLIMLFFLAAGALEFSVYSSTTTSGGPRVALAIVVKADREAYRDFELESA